MNPPDYPGLAQPPSSPFEPEMVELLEDWMNFESGHALPQGSILQRFPNRQYATPEPIDDNWCGVNYSEIKDISRPLRAAEIHAWNRRRRA